ncbi:DUF1697 domain-containing protein [Pandoraea sp.]|uniref:DUF1697 domain-containing protein n=1 Tax=Pandoraea sp. TaxID=1883445 RepID=UPI0012110F4A|nr:DUF1697 domain-containing protein [Pandoraea sp.]TAL52876.1 MAG: DUF1697 domain-containing protein [Pandoraea sp.]TAM19679.1 MAG: DUF1697 domain-containing protein [Pandoraea sp.]
MTVFIALLRAVNVGGTGILPMKVLSAHCAGLGFERVRTYIQSGNVVFESAGDEGELRRLLANSLADLMGKPVGVALRSAPALAAVLDANPFPDAPPAQVAVAFHHALLPRTLLDGFTAPGGEEVRLGQRELYAYYPNGMGRSRLKLPLPPGEITVRNINTVSKLVALAGD